MKTLKKLILTILLPVLGGVAAYAQTSVKVRGVVTSADDGLPMIGAAVMDGKGAGVVTSLDGDYEIVVAPGTELVFSSIGFNEERVVVPQAEVVIHNVVMRPESIKLDEGLVIAYGVRKLFCKLYCSRHFHTAKRAVDNFVEATDITARRRNLVFNYSVSGSVLVGIATAIAAVIVSFGVVGAWTVIGRVKPFARRQ